MRSLSFLVLLVAGTASAEEHLVREGETLRQIARIYYGDDASGPIVLAAGNGYPDLDTTRVLVGQRLVVPMPLHISASVGETWESLAERAFGTRRRAAFLARANGKTARQSPETGAEIVIPIVLTHHPDRRDTLASIAKRYYGALRTGPRLLRDFNDLRMGRPPEDRPVLVPFPDLRVTRAGQEALARASASFTDGTHARAQREIATALAGLETLFDEGRYYELVMAVSRLLGRSAATGNQLVTLNRLLAYAYVALDEEDLAIDAFREALRHQPDLELNPITTSPKILGVFRRARRPESRAAPNPG